jgi:tetratricopeptide (TPR) repeat protein
MFSKLRAFLSIPNYQIILVLLITALAYSNILSNGFVWDDHDFIENWTLVRTFPENIKPLILGAQPSFHNGVYRPIRNLYITILYNFFKQDPVLYHVQSIVINLVITYLIILITKKITKNQLIGVFCGLIFGLHPMHTEAVTWIMASFDLLGIGSLLLGFYLFLISGKKKSKARYLSLLFTFISFFGNEICLTLPLIITFYLWIFKSTSKLKSKYFSPAISYYVLAVVYVFIRVMLIPNLVRSARPLNGLFQNLILILEIFFVYIKLLVLPLGLNVIHNFSNGIPNLFTLDRHISTIYQPASPLASLMLIIFMGLYLWAIIYCRSRRPLISFGLGWIIITLLPVLQIFPQPVIFAERYVYLASVGFVMILVSFINEIWNKFKRYRFYITILVILLLVSYSTLTWHRNRDYANDLTLWKKALAYMPNSATALNSLGSTYFNNKDINTALPLFEKAVLLNPNVINRYNLGMTYFALSRYGEAIPQFQSILKEYPHDNEIQHLLGDSYYKAGDFQKAMLIFEATINEYPNDTYARKEISLIELEYERSKTKQENIVTY